MEVKNVPEFFTLIRYKYEKLLFHLNWDRFPVSISISFYVYASINPHNQSTQQTLLHILYHTENNIKNPIFRFIYLLPLIGIFIHLILSHFFL